MKEIVITNGYINAGDGCASCAGAQVSDGGSPGGRFPGGRFPGGRCAGGGCPGGRFPGGSGGCRRKFWPGT